VDISPKANPRPDPSPHGEPLPRPDRCTREALADEHAQAQAADLIRKLVDKIGLTPVKEEGRPTLSIDLHGHLAAILSLATKAKRPLGESGPEVGYTKLVAGARNRLNLLLTANVILPKNQ
jgi:hypothetical protein